MKVIHVLRKPLSEKTVAANVLEHGTGALNIDASRIATSDSLGGGAAEATRPEQKGNEGWTRPWMDDPDAREGHAARVRDNILKAEDLGRWPSNMILEHHPDCGEDCTPDCPLEALGGRQGVSRFYKKAARGVS